MNTFLSEKEEAKKGDIIYFRKNMKNSELYKSLYNFKSQKQLWLEKPTIISDDYVDYLCVKHLNRMNYMEIYDIDKH